MSTNTPLSHWLRIFTVSAALFLGFTSPVRASTISTSRSNIKHQSSAAYSPKGGLVLTFTKNGMDIEDKKALESGKFVVTDNIILTPAECKSINAPAGTVIKKGEYKLTPTATGGTCVISNK